MSSRFKFYGTNTNLHGLKYVADEKRYPGIRIFWTLVFMINFCIMLWMFKASYTAFQENAISFVTETTYLDWNTTFPAITLCPIAGSEPEWDNKEIQISYRKKCPDILLACKWNIEKFSCCEHMLPLETEYGICYSLNSLHTQKTIHSQMSLMMNRKTGPGELWLQTDEDVRVYFHAPEDVPFINSDPDQRKDVMLGESFNISINVIEIENDENVKHLPVRKRECKFPWENDGLVVHNYYSYSTCVVQCHAENHIRLCNCTHHLMPVYNRKTYCDIEGLKCLTDNFETVNRLHAKGFDQARISLRLLAVMF
ncbi:hypothetical protein NQ314_010173 [Rhamnusium bicolor]|uniref:Sodium channel protein Nach n=1 Tax=Rhamnusium bicolor TaxID=1586634 RepID=A0AAV8XSV1_9CUCU|nr:hypothetical protein NQ314_010173 [Rhamnusium bicolor]